MNAVEAVGQHLAARSAERLRERRERSGLLGRSAVRAFRVEGVAVFGLGVEAADRPAERDVEMVLVGDLGQVDGRRVARRGRLPVAHLHRGGRFARAEGADGAGRGHERPAFRDGRRGTQERRGGRPDHVADGDDAAAAPSGGVVPESAAAAAAEAVLAVFSDGIAANAAAAAAAEAAGRADVSVVRRHVRVAAAAAREMLPEAEDVGRQAVAADAGMETEGRLADIRAQRPAWRARAAAAAAAAVVRGALHDGSAVMPLAGNPGSAGRRIVVRPRAAAAAAGHESGRGVVRAASAADGHVGDRTADERRIPGRRALVLRRPHAAGSDRDRKGRVGGQRLARRFDHAARAAAARLVGLVAAAASSRDEKESGGQRLRGRERPGGRRVREDVDVVGITWTLQMQDHVAAGRIGGRGDPVRVRREIAEEGRLRDHRRKD